MCPVGIGLGVDRGQVIEFPCLNGVSFQEPCFGKVVIIFSILRMEVDGALQNPNGFIGFAVPQESLPLVGKCRGSQCHGTGFGEGCTRLFFRLRGRGLPNRRFFNRLTGRLLAADILGGQGPTRLGFFHGWKRLCIPGGAPGQEEQTRPDHKKPFKIRARFF